jgi:5-methylcytosine-specific restriction endonuclease McrA
MKKLLKKESKYDSSSSSSSESEIEEKKKNTNTKKLIASKNTKKCSDSDSESNSESDSELESDVDNEEEREFVIQQKTTNYQLRSFYDSFLKNDKIILNPEYQREFCWNKEKQNLLIDSIMRSFIIPVFIIRKIESKTGFTYECVDGQHRLKVIKNYISGEPIDDNYVSWRKKSEDKTKKNIYENIYYEQTDELKKKKVRGKRFMTEKEMDIFNNFTISVCVIENSLSFNQICNVFSRLQNGAKVTTLDRFKNSIHPICDILRKFKLTSYATYDDPETWMGYIKSKMTNKKNTYTSKASQVQKNVDVIIMLIVISLRNSLDQSYLPLNMMKYIEGNYTSVSIAQLKEHNIFESLDDVIESIKSFIEYIKLMNSTGKDLCQYMTYALYYIWINNDNAKNIIKKLFESELGDYNKESYYMAKDTVPKSEKLIKTKDEIIKKYNIVEEDKIDDTKSVKKVDRKIPATVRNTVWNKYIGTDKKIGNCHCCQFESISFANFECGHVISVKNGGETTIENLRPICPHCNKSMGAMNMEEFMKKYGFDQFPNKELNKDKSKEKFKSKEKIKTK